jgi:hypothetical protein
MAQQALSKREDSSVLMISTLVANAMALLKNHLPDLDIALLCKDFTVEKAEREALTNGAYVLLMNSLRLMTFLVLLSPKTMTVQGTCNSSPVHCSRYLLIKENI